MSRHLPPKLLSQLTRPVLRNTSSQPSLHRRHISDVSSLQTEMLSRRAPLIYDDLSPIQSYKLQVSLSPFLPSSWTDPNLYPSADYASKQPALPPSHHLVYFNAAIPNDKLLPDGTDPLQSPGEPFVRRMWAGGSVRFRQGWGQSGGLEEKPLALTRRRYVCMERIRDVQVKGKEGDEKVFVGIERRIGVAPEEVGVAGGAEGEAALRERLWSEAGEEDFAESVLVERRNIVFMRERSPEEAKKAAATATTKLLRAQHAPEFTHSFTPTPSLLFRYSALTFNAHAIHLDPQYSREVEGHRNLLFHGPLSLTMLITMLNNKIGGKKANPENVIKSIEYRNLAPIYCSEKLTLCGREVEKGSGKYEVWAENEQGGVCVRGTAKTGKST